jgi:hypothetical protein
LTKKYKKKKCEEGKTNYFLHEKVENYARIDKSVNIRTVTSGTIRLYSGGHQERRLILNFFYNLGIALISQASAFVSHFLRGFTSKIKSISISMFSFVLVTKI